MCGARGDAGLKVAVEFQERYWYPDDGGEVWVAGYTPVDASGRFMGRDALAAQGLLVASVAGAVHRPEALASDGAAPGRPLTLVAEPDNPHDPNAVAVLTSAGLALGYVPRELAPRIGEGWSAIVLRERRATPRDPRNGLTMLLAQADAIELAGGCVR
jgi:HIRAN domain